MGEVLIRVKPPPTIKKIMRVINVNGKVATYLKDLDVCGKKVKSFRDENGEIVFGLSSISKVLGYGDPNKLSSLLGESRKKKLVVDSGNGIFPSWFVDSLGLVSLIIKSRKLDESMKLEFIEKYFILN